VESGSQARTEHALEGKVCGVGAAHALAPDDQQAIAPRHHLVIPPARWPLVPLRRGHATSAVLPPAARAGSYPCPVVVFLFVVRHLFFPLERGGGGGGRTLRGGRGGGGGRRRGWPEACPDVGVEVEGPQVVEAAPAPVAPAWLSRRRESRKCSGQHRTLRGGRRCLTGEGWGGGGG
jgi:hypothetical protein